MDGRGTCCDAQQASPSFGGAKCMRVDVAPMPTSSSYPLDAGAAARASPASALSAAQRRAWAAAFASLRAGGAVSLLMLGGSLARGQGFAVY